MTLTKNAHIYGAILGDVLGVPYEFLPPQKDITFTSDGIHNQPLGSWSDDTSLILATLDGNTIEDIKQNFRNWLLYSDYTSHGDVFDVGLTTRDAITNDADTDKDHMNGNGSLMRICAIYEDFKANKDYEYIEDISRLTHQHKVPIDCCKYFLDYMLLIDEGENKVDAKNICDRKYSIESNLDPQGYVVGSLNIAIKCFIETDNFLDCIKRAVSYGYDTDTNACVAGAVAGLHYGIEESLLKHITRIEIIEDVLNQKEIPYNH